MYEPHPHPTNHNRDYHHHWCDRELCCHVSISFNSLIMDKNNNSGYRNSGYRNSGGWNSGDWNSGDNNSGGNNSGHRNTGYRNSGYRNSGYRNSGGWNSGDCNSGYRNSGDWNSGEWNSGDWNSGDCNSGDRNSGDWNSCNYETGYFNSFKLDAIRVFNEECSREEWSNADKPDFLFFELTDWIYSDNMTEEEKEENPEHVTTGGYLKTYEYKEAFQKSWDKADEEDRQKVFNLPNFDAGVFYEISGIDVRKPAVTELTLEDIADKFGVDVKNIKIKK